MLLASSITPSGAAWARESVQASIPDVRLIEAVPSQQDALIGSIAGRLSPAGLVAPDLVAGLTSIQSAAGLATAIHASLRDGTAVWWPGSLAAAASDLLTVASLLDLADPSNVTEPGIRELIAAAAALRSGEVQWIVACPPEESAIAVLAAEVGVAMACGIAVRGVAVCPMPRKSDGWPKVIRDATRRRADEVSQLLHPLPVARSRRGQSPAFTDAGAVVCDESVTSHANDQWIWSMTIPGSSVCSVSIGVWSNDPAYPTTHVVLDIGGRTVYRAVDATLRRCAATEAVVSGDSVAVTFLPAPEQWPTIQAGGAGDG